jgi:hypothetical protein
MRGNQQHSRKGQALLMTTFALVAMCGMIGLAVDLGWSFYTKRSAQTAADSAALAAAQQALDTTGQGGSFVCGNGMIACSSSPTPCDASVNLTTGCQYAQQHGFTVGGNGGRQNVAIAADITSPPPTAPGVKVDYWVTVRTYENIPQLFSSALNNTAGGTASRATAAVVNAPLPAQLYTLNRQNDVPAGSKKGDTGNDISLQGSDSITTYGPIAMASTDLDAGRLGGSGNVSAPVTFIRGSGSVNNPGNWVSAPQNGLPDGSPFLDPMQGKGQPPPPTGLSDHPVLAGAVPANSVLASGNYFAVDNKGKPTGAPITFGANVTFKDGAFGNWVIFGGISGGVSFGPGRYILAGSMTGTTVNWDKVMVTDQTPVDANGNIVAPQDAGELFVTTDHNYPGLQIPSVLTGSPVLNNLNQGNVLIKSGNAGQWGLDIHGLNPNDPNVPQELIKFAPAVFWQDQANSTIKYNPDGTIDTSCGDLDSPCANKTLKDVNSTFSSIDARPNISMWGMFYQPRGAGLAFQGHGTFTAPVELITGYLSLQGGGSLNLQKLTAPPRRRVVALIE